MSVLNSLKQLLLPGVKKAKGAERIAGKPGYYTIDPAAANSETKAILKRAERRAMDEGQLAERPNDGPISMRGRENARGAYMLSGALNELRYAADAGGALGKPVKGIVYVDKSGNPRAGAAINKEKAAEYLSDDFDLDFTKASPNYLEYISTTTPDVRGSDLMRLMQELHGDDMVFQVANPKKNVPIYESWGARRMAPRVDGGDVLGGDAGLPAFRIEKRVPERGAEVVEDVRQLRLPGFADGGTLLDHGARQKEFEKSGKAMRGGLESLGNFVYDMMVPQDAVDVGLMMVGGPGGKLIKKAGAALLGANAGDAEAGVIGKATRAVKEMPFHSDMALDRFVGGKQVTTPLYVDPTQAELGKLMKASRESSIRDNSSPTIRYLVDLKSPKRPIYAVEGNEALHSEMRGHLGLSSDDTLGEMWAPGRQRGSAADVLEYLKTFQQPIRKRYGGLACMKGAKHG